MNDLKIFENPEFGKIRTIKFEGEFWFVGKDVAKALGYVNTKKALIDHVDAEDKRRNDGVILRDSMGREQHPTIINESGVYSLILNSRLQNAKNFKRWVISEVLPSIHKYGMYAIDEVLENPDILIAALTELKLEREQRKQLEAKVEEMKPKVSYYDLVLQSKDLVPISVIAKDYGISAQELNNILHRLGVQYKRGETWLLYQKYANKGYASSRTFNLISDDSPPHAKIHTYWTQKGRLFIYEKLKNNGIIPLIERNNV